MFSNAHLQALTEINQARSSKVKHACFYYYLSPPRRLSKAPRLVFSWWNGKESWARGERGPRDDSEVSTAPEERLSHETASASENVHPRGPTNYPRTRFGFMWSFITRIKFGEHRVAHVLSCSLYRTEFIRLVFGLASDFWATQLTFKIGQVLVY